MESRTIETGETVYVDSTERFHASKGPFEQVYLDADGTTAWGYACSNCESLDTAVDTMGRIVCNQCGNTRKPEEWDAAHE